MNRPDYKNWIPQSLLYGLYAGTAAALLCFLLFALSGFGLTVLPRVILSLLFAALTAILGYYSSWCRTAYDAFSYDGERKLSRQIIEGTASRIRLPVGGVGLDVGCGSGALTIACAKQNPQGRMLGVDRWGREYACFSQTLCQQNAAAEGVSNVTFQQGNAIKLPFADETFDAVTSNYVYHNITGMDRQQLLLETLRVLKKGGTFAIHDLLSPRRYGDLDAFMQELRAQGYERIDLIDTTNGLFMSRSEAKKLMLTGSALLVGKK